MLGNQILFSVGWDDAYFYYFLLSMLHNKYEKESKVYSELTYLSEIKLKYVFNGLLDHPIKYNMRR